MNIRSYADESTSNDNLSTTGVTKAYDAWAPFYDLVFGKVFERGRHEAIRSLKRSTGHLLEVGVGTGLSLGEYPPGLILAGVDISEHMLAKARLRVRALGLNNVESLTVMNAERLDFPDNAFDVVVAQYVITAVPHPEAALDEFVRVTKPGGEIVLTSRISAEAGIRRKVERLLSPLVNRLGWRTDFPWARYERWIEQAGCVRIAERRPLPPLGHFSLIRLIKAV